MKITGTTELKHIVRSNNVDELRGVIQQLQARIDHLEYLERLTPSAGDPVIYTGRDGQEQAGIVLRMRPGEAWVKDKLGHTYTLDPRALRKDRRAHAG